MYFHIETTRNKLCSKWRYCKLITSYDVCDNQFRPSKMVNDIILRCFYADRHLVRITSRFLISVIHYWRNGYGKVKREFRTTECCVRELNFPQCDCIFPARIQQVKKRINTTLFRSARFFFASNHKRTNGPTLDQFYTITQTAHPSSSFRTGLTSIFQTSQDESTTLHWMDNMLCTTTGLWDGCS